jgi:hypothetical protein
LIQFDTSVTEKPKLPLVPACQGCAIRGSVASSALGAANRPASMAFCSRECDLPFKGAIDLETAGNPANVG